ncbi:hypothetical protein [Vreelandella venusta]|uniref:hypothetical protein n=1 Tax=Vreelandella venusta TaxID=44935 RepID=UPI00384B1FC9
MHNLWIPVVAIFIVAGLISGGQAYSEAQRDAHIATSISERLGSQTQADISHLKAMEFAAIITLPTLSMATSTTTAPPSA